MPRSQRPRSQNPFSEQRKKHPEVSDWKTNTLENQYLDTTLPTEQAEPKISQQNPGRLSHPMARATYLTLQRKNYKRQASFQICSFTFVTVVLLEILVPKINFSVVFNKIHSG